MLLALGDSFAVRLADHLEHRSAVSCAGQRGARLSEEAFRIWALRTAVARKPRAVLVIIGGNDLAQPAFRRQTLMAQFRELSLGLLAAGVEPVHILAVHPRGCLRRGDVSGGCFRHRRRLDNSKLRHQFWRPPVQYIPFPTVAGFLGRDGAHPSRKGWGALSLLVQKLL